MKNEQNTKNKIEWKENKLLEITKITMGQSPPGDSYNINGEGTPFFQGKAEFMDRYPVVKKWTTKPSKMAEPISILISVRAPVGDVNLCNIKCCIGRGLASIKPNDYVCLEYLFFYLSKNKDKIASLGTGSIFKAISSKKLENIKIPLPFKDGKPDLKEQERIVNILEKAVKLKERGKNAERLLDDYLKSVFHEIFYDKGFEEIKLMELYEINPKKSELEKVDGETKVSFLEMASVGEKGEIFAEDIRKLKDVIKGLTYFRKNDVLFAKITPCMENGKGAIAKISKDIGFGSTEFHVLRPIKNKSTPEWIYFLLSLNTIRKSAERNMTGSAGQKRVPKQFLQNLKIPLPPLPLQQKFAKVVEQVEKMKKDVKETRDNSEELFNSLMSKAFRGEL